MARLAEQLPAATEFPFVKLQNYPFAQIVDIRINSGGGIKNFVGVTRRGFEFAVGRDVRHDCVCGVFKSFPRRGASLHPERSHDALLNKFIPGKAAHTRYHFARNNCEDFCAASYAAPHA